MLSTTWTEKPTQRLLAAIAYKNGVIQTELAEWYGVQRRTIYSWLKRLDTEESLEQAVTNTHRSIKNWKLSGKEEEQSEATVHESPEEVGLDAPARTPVPVQQDLDETYDVEYSIPSCQRLLKEAGLSYRKQRLTAAESDADEQETFREEFKKAAEAGRHSSLYRSNQEIRTSRAACRVVSPQYAAVCRIIRPTRLDVSLGRDHRRR